MATPNASSIVDFLKQRGFVPEQGERFPLFSQRKRIFEQLNLPAEGTEFRGTAQENLALLSRLGQSEREAGIGITPENFILTHYPTLSIDKFKCSMIISLIALWLATATLTTSSTANVKIVVPDISSDTFAFGRVE